jgi:DNA-binding IscR family transcriptional regulator
MEAHVDNRAATKPMNPSAQTSMPAPSTAAFGPSPRVLDAIRVLVEIGARPERPSTLAETSWRLKLPMYFVERTLRACAKAGLVVLRRGAGGGAQLGRTADSIKLAEIAEAMGERRAGGSLADDPSFMSLFASIDDWLARTTVADLIAARAGAPPLRS